jgi:hypothetical protein
VAPRQIVHEETGMDRIAVVVAVLAAATLIVAGVR